MKTPLGELLVESGIITMKTLERALTRQRGSGKRLGVVLDEMGVITPEELIEALARQYGFETVKGIASQIIPEHLLELIPEEIAFQKLVFPLKQQDSALAVAITDPFDTDTLQLLETRCGARIVPVLATREDILEGVKQHYLRGMPVRNEAPRVLLVVDDSTEITAEIAEALSKEGYQMLMANDGVQGLTIAFSQRPDLILCDATLPRMDGYALMRAVKANPATAGTPIILLTAKVSPEEEHRALKSGFHDFIAKPMMTVRVVARVKRAFDLMQHNRQQQAVPAA